MDLVNWIGDASSEQEIVQNLADEIGGILANSLIAELDDLLYHANQPRFRRATNDHFLCELLASLACGISEVRESIDKSLDQLAGSAAAAVVGSRKKDSRSVVEYAIVERAVEKTIQAIVEPFTAQVDEQLLVMRILAVLFCSTPERHRSVYACCLRPIIKNKTQKIISEEVEQRLRETLEEGGGQPESNE